MKLNLECLEGTTEVGGLRLIGGNKPKTLKGVSALHPGQFEFDAGSGELEGEGSEGKIEGKTEGGLKTLGYEEQEVVNAKER